MSLPTVGPCARSKAPLLSNGLVASRTTRVWRSPLTSTSRQRSLRPGVKCTSCHPSMSVCTPLPARSSSRLTTCGVMQKFHNFHGTEQVSWPRITCLATCALTFPPAGPEGAEEEEEGTDGQEGRGQGQHPAQDGGRDQERPLLRMQSKSAFLVHISLFPLILNHASSGGIQEDSL